jgi:hypothetical protein
MENEFQLSTIIDNFIYDKVFWFAKLSNGLTVYQDDDRMGVQPPWAWVRLANYLKESGTRISGLGAQFRSHCITPLPTDSQGYFYCQSSLGTNFSPRTLSFYKLGYLKDRKIYIKVFTVPELELVDEEIRPEEEGKVFLIKNVYTNNA